MPIPSPPSYNNQKVSRHGQMSSEGKITFGSKPLERDRQGADHVEDVLLWSFVLYYEQWEAFRGFRCGFFFFFFFGFRC